MKHRLPKALQGFAEMGPMGWMWLAFWVFGLGYPIAMAYGVVPPL